MTLARIGSSLAMLLQDDGEGATAAAAGFAALGGVMLAFWLALIVLIIASMWKVFEKAGQPGWAALIPIFNFYVLLKVAGRPGWWLLLAIIPFVNLILLVLPFDVARRFGKSSLFGLGLLLLGFIFYPILAWGDARYEG